MKLLKLMLISSLLLTSLKATADHTIAIIGPIDYKADCEAAIQAAQNAISARDKEIQDQSTEITDLQAALNISRSQTVSADNSLNLWYHNPFIVGLIGAAVGGIGIAVLEHR